MPEGSGRYKTQSSSYSRLDIISKHVMKAMLWCVMKKRSAMSRAKRLQKFHDDKDSTKIPTILINDGAETVGGGKVTLALTHAHCPLLFGRSSTLCVILTSFGFL